MFIIFVYFWEWTFHALDVNEVRDQNFALKKNGSGLWVNNDFLWANNEKEVRYIFLKIKSTSLSLCDKLFHL